MISDININENEKDFLEIKLTSDAFEEGMPPFYKSNPDKYYQEISPIHKILFRLEKNKPLSININYKVLDDEKYIEDLKDLFKEWFPFSYDRDYFRKYFIRQSYIAIGALIEINMKDYLVGCVLGEMISGDKFKKILPDVLIDKTFFGLFEAVPVECGVLQSLGVIDEYRRLGVGTKLMEMFIEEVKKRGGVSIYLSTLSYNNSAIKFFENNQWYFYENLKNYYRVHDKTFDAQIYYYIIDIKKCKKLKKKPLIKNKYNGVNGNAEEGVSEIPEQEEKGCMASIFGFFNKKNEN